MALFGKDEKIQRPEGAGPSMITPPPRAANGPPGDEAAHAHLAKGSRVEGKLTFEGSVKIDGCVEGEIEAQQAVIIGEGAAIDARINAETVIVKGKVNGDITARKQVELRAPGKLVGNITTPSLVIHEGVFFEGHCSMGGGASDSKAERTERKVTLLPKEERSNPSPVRMPSEAVK